LFVKIHEEDFESELRAALRAEAPPEDFAAKVLARAAALSPKPQVIAIPLWRKPAAWALAAGLAVAAVIPPAASEYQRRRELRALEARRELLLALSITRAKLRQTRERVQKNTRRIL